MKEKPKWLWRQKHNTALKQWQENSKILTGGKHSNALAKCTNILCQVQKRVNWNQSAKIIYPQKEITANTEKDFPGPGKNNSNNREQVSPTKETKEKEHRILTKIKTKKWGGNEDIIKIAKKIRTKRRNEQSIDRVDKRRNNCRSNSNRRTEGKYDQGNRRTTYV